MYNVSFDLNQETKQKVKEEQEEITKTLLQRIFPEIKVSEKTHEQWLKTFEDKVSAILNELKQKNTDHANPDLERQNKNLQNMVSHYKQIIDDTVSSFLSNITLFYTILYNWCFYFTFLF